MREPLHIAIALAHPLAKRRRIPLRALANEDFVLFPADVAPGLHAQVMDLCFDAGFVPRVVQVSRELYTTVSLVEAGVGVTIIPASIEKMGWTGVRYVPIADPKAQTRIAMATLADAQASKPVVRAFADVVRER
jgi:DNA-binding transcriptional LysR family regulator